MTPTGPHHGSARVYVDGVYKKTVSTYSKTRHFRRVVWATWNGPPLAGHTITIVNLATPGHPFITVDAIANLTDD